MSISSVLYHVNFLLVRHFTNVLRVEQVVVLLRYKTQTAGDQSTKIKKSKGGLNCF